MRYLARGVVAATKSRQQDQQGRNKKQIRIHAPAAVHRQKVDLLKLVRLSDVLGVAKRAVLTGAALAWQAFAAFQQTQDIPIELAYTRTVMKYSAPVRLQ